MQLGLLVGLFRQAKQFQFAPKGQVILAQGNALGKRSIKEKALKGRLNMRFFEPPFQGFTRLDSLTQGVALGYNKLPRWGVLKGMANQGV